jgi:spore maturation protein SpmA
MAEVSKASVESAKAAVTLALGLIGVMAFWLGLMRVVQEAGFLAVLARWLRPVMVRLFPDVPPEHPAMSAMILNIASNMLGLGNAATPFGIKAMHELNRLNPRPGVATDAMVLFLAINTSSVAVAPLGVIATRAAVGSNDAAGIWLPTLMATSLSTAVAILTAKALQRVVPPVTAYAAASDDVSPAPAVAPAETTVPAARATRPLGCGVALAVIAATAVGFALYLNHGWGAGETTAALLRDSLSSWVLPVLIVTMLLYGVAKGVAVYDTMIAGAREGFEVAVRIIPFLVAIVVAAGMFRASGLLDLIVRAVGPFTDPLGFPARALPMALLRPLSGSGAYAIMAETMQAEGPDSRVGYLVSVLQGSSETTFYVLAVYFGAVAVTRVRHALAAGLTADVAAVVWSVLAVNWYVGN